MLVSKRYDVQDCRYYDDASTNKASNYQANVRSATISHSTNKYVVTNIQSNDFTPITPIGITLGNNEIFEVDMQCSNIMGMGLLDSNGKYISVNMYTSSHEAMIYDYANKSQLTQSKGTISTDWLHCTLKLVDNVISVKIYNNDVEVYSDSATLPTYYQGKTLSAYISTYWKENPLSFRNMKIKPL